MSSSNFMDQSTKLLAQERDKSFSKPSTTTPRPKKKDDDIEDLVRMAAAGVGFVSEALHHRRDKKKEKMQSVKSIPQEQQQQQQQKIQDTPHISEQLINAIWELDDVEQEATTVQHTTTNDKQDKDTKKAPKEPSDLAKAFLDRHPEPQSLNPNPPTKKLSLPIILPQRRPKTRARGFVRAYSPFLQDIGISQSTFLDFLDTFNKSLEPNPALEVINLAGFAGSAMPDPVSLLFGIGVEVFTYATIEGETRYRSNKFLDHVNAKFFARYGLTCLVVTWRSDEGGDGDEQDVISTVDLEAREDVASAASERMNIRQQMKSAVAERNFNEKMVQNMREQIQEGIKSYHGVFEYDTPAPLVFPSMEESAIGQGKAIDVKKKKAMARAGAWLDEYRDKSAQAEWREDNPNLPVVGLLPKPEFKSRYADPSHPAASGDLVAFMTGGRWQGTTEEEIRKRAEKEARKEVEKEAKKEAKETKEAEKKAKEADRKEREAEKKAEKKAKEAERKAKEAEKKFEKKAQKEARRASKGEGDKEGNGKDSKSEERELKTQPSKSTTGEEQTKNQIRLEEKGKTPDHQTENPYSIDSKRKSSESKKGNKKKQPSGLSTLLQEDIIYLLIVNAPRKDQTDQAAVDTLS